jgi:hypothetical protein
MKENTTCPLEYLIFPEIIMKLTEKYSIQLFIFLLLILYVTFIETNEDQK